VGLFAVRQGARPAAPDETIAITILKHNGEFTGFNRWLLNGVAFSMQTMKPAYTVSQGRRYRLRFRNAATTFIPSIFTATASNWRALVARIPQALSKTW
jgi:hypothetical protein